MNILAVSCLVHLLLFTMEQLNVYSSVSLFKNLNPLLNFPQMLAISVIYKQLCALKKY